MPTKNDARYPAHAQKEIDEAKGKRKAELQRFWDSWADVGDAKRAERDAFSEVVDAQLAFAECRASVARQFGAGSLPPGECACGDHARSAIKAQQEREKALSAIDRAIGTFKDGG